MKIGVKQIGVWLSEKKVGTIALDKNGLGCKSGNPREFNSRDESVFFIY